MLNRPLARCALSLVALISSFPEVHASTDISQTPLITSVVRTKPNIMFVLDNSGSMTQDYTPDALEDSDNDGVSIGTRYGYRSAQCNGSAFNPSVTYSPPVTPDGRRYPNIPITLAWNDGFRPAFSSSVNLDATLNTVLPADGSTISVTLNTNLAVGTRVAFLNRGNRAIWMSGTVTRSSNGLNTILLTFSSMHDGSKSDWTLGVISTTNLSTSGHYYTYRGSQPRMAWTYTNTGTLDRTNTFVRECLSAVNTSPGSTVFDRVNVSTLTATQQQNYANWYSYYRTRILNMRTAAGEAVAGLDSGFRIGFNTLNVGTAFNTTVTDTLGQFADIRDFDDAQRIVFFSNLYGASADGGTPLRRALSKVGRYFGNALTGQTDPVPAATLACQRNYTLLTTDGYWNDGSNPVRLDGTAIGNWDGDISRTPRPMYDGTGDSVTIERRVTTVRISNTGCGFFFTSPTYRHTVEQRTVTRVAGAITSATAWTVASTTQDCSSSMTVSNTVVSSGGASNTLADVATYYRSATLSRPQTGPASAGMPSIPVMTTYTLGFGLSGLLRYSPTYLSDTTGDYLALKNGTKSWPAPSSNNPTTVDDLWHAAVNGGGVYYSASDPEQLVQSLRDAFNSFDGSPGAGASAASSSLQPVFGTDQIFVGSYQTLDWYGNLRAFTLRDGTSTYNDNPDWEANVLLNGVPHTQRNIFFMGRTVTSTGGEIRSLRPFTYQRLSEDADAATLTAHFDNLCSKPRQPSQCSRLTTAQRTAASGANLVNFLRGDRSNEGSLFRRRTFVLGPIVDASPVFVGKPPFAYTDAGYSSFKSSQNSRCPVVYAAANDGMLHAFSAARTANPGCVAGGNELWAYVPRAVMGEMYRLSDSDYASNHRFLVNGTPVVGDISRTVEGNGDPVPVWSTILVGGYGAGGRGYYALDITNPGSPSALWEFSDADMGLSYGNPVITKVPDANGSPTWVVAFTSGLNNSGNGYLYILNAHTGQVMYKIATMNNGAAVGTASAPSGLNKLNAWVERTTDNTALRFYAGDMLGHLWRFNAQTAESLAPQPGADSRAFLVARFINGSRPQPITIRPELAKINNQAVVLLGTGRYLGTSDASDLTSVQSIYGVKDPLESSAGWGNIRATTGALVEQTLTLIPANAATGQPERRKVSANTVDWDRPSVAGWFIDLPDAGERVVVQMGIAFDTLSLATLVPSSSPCSGSGYSWLFNLSIRTGSFTTDNVATEQAAEKSGEAIMGINIVQPQEQSETREIITKARGGIEVKRGARSPSTQGGLRRTSWREIVPPPQ